jgi:hypothetical protein
METTIIRSPIENEILRILESQPLWDGWKQVGLLMHRTDFNDKGLPLTGAETQTPLAKRHFELRVLWNSIAYPLGSGRIPRSEWEDLLVEGIEIYKEFLRAEPVAHWNSPALERLFEKRHERLAQWKKDPEISKLLIQFQGED